MQCNKIMKLNRIGWVESLMLIYSYSDMFILKKSNVQIDKILKAFTKINCNLDISIFHFFGERGLK